jgi:hypothetical protein
VIERTDHTATTAIQNMGVNHRGFNIGGLGFGSKR